MNKKKKLLWHAHVTKDSGRSFWFFVEAPDEQRARKQVKKELYLPASFDLNTIHVEKAVYPCQ